MHIPQHTHNLIFLLAFIIFSNVFIKAQHIPQTSPAPEKFSLVELRDTGIAPLKNILTAEAEKAWRLKRAPFILMYADWCPPCHNLFNSLKTDIVSDAFKGTYIILLDHDLWYSKMREIGMRSYTIPKFFELDGAGNFTGHSGGSWYGEDTAENIIEALNNYFSCKILLEKENETNTPPAQN